MHLDRKSILASLDCEPRETAVPEWGGSVFLKVLSVGEGIAFQTAKVDTPAERIVPLLLTFALCDERGQALFSADDGGVEELCRKSPIVLSRLFTEALDLNQMGGKSEEDLPNG